MALEIRQTPHGSADYRRAVELRRRILRLPLGLDFSEEELAAENREAHFVAMDGAELIGCLVMTPLSDGKVKMRQVAVEDGHRNRGIGAQMVAASERWSREMGFERIELNARDAAIAFYERLDYRKQGDPFEEVTITHQKMMKYL